MRKIISIILVFALFITFSCIEVLAAENQNMQGASKKPKVVKENTFKLKEKEFNKIENKEKDVSATTPTSEELIPVNVKNEFDEEIRVKLDTNREYPVGPNEWITLGKRKPGRYTLTIYNKKGDFVDNLTKNIDKKNKFVLNKDTVSNSDKIIGLSAGQKVAITAGAVGAAALGAAVINKVLMGGQEEVAGPYNPPLPQEQVSQEVPPGVVSETVRAEINNAIASDGKPFKFLNRMYDKVTVVVEGTDGSPIGNNWIIPKANVLQAPKPLIYNGQQIAINSSQKVKIVLPDGRELVRNGFELEEDKVDGSFVWILK